ncbi:unnamed protein product [Ceutorhynchus assimilis]|uniref:C2H2-type domain-containing protein n=1 Tax=Ceutorhynchus assimilis TaxID=467358 RepID=A0A9N9MJH8_9CUCU|nr:unnamed protein product [Ceutorhynchus assimilis]
MQKHNPDGSFAKFPCTVCNKIYSSRTCLYRHELICKGLTSIQKCKTCNKQVDSSLMRDHNRTHQEKRYECHICHKKFKENWYLKKHVLLHADRLKFPCDVCGFMCATQYTAQLHKKAKHTKEFAAFCDLCGKGFVNVSFLNNHKKKTHKDENEPTQLYQCTVEGCNKTYRSNKSLKLHLPTHCEQKPVHPCPHCSKILHHPESLKRHIRINHSGNPKKIYECRVCNKTLATNASLNKHLMIHTGEKPFVCESCGKCFNKRSLLRIHMVVHTKQRPYVCKVCKKGFTQLKIKTESCLKCKQCGYISTSPIFLKEHTVMVHTHEYRYFCDFCNKGFFMKCRKRSHERSVHQKTAKRRPKGKPWTCNECGRVLANKFSFKQHKLLVHERELNFCCDKCGKGFPLLSYLTQHEQVNHPTSEPLTCPDCDKRFKTRDALRRHQHVHSDNREFHCEVCPKKFIHITSFKRHLREHKNGRKIFACEVCRKIVTSTSSLQDHMRTHTGEKPFNCTHCDKTFVTNKQLKVHIVVHTKEKRHLCKVCDKRFTQRSTLKAHFLKNHPGETLDILNK